jgi:hypothetical protein
MRKDLQIPKTENYQKGSGFRATRHLHAGNVFVLPVEDIRRAAAIEDTMFTVGLMEGVSKRMNAADPKVQIAIIQAMKKSAGQLKQLQFRASNNRHPKKMGSISQSGRLKIMRSSPPHWAKLNLTLPP